MSETAEQLMPTLAALPEQDRAALAKFLLESLDPPGEDIGPAEWEAAWAAEADRRLAEMESGKVPPIPVEEMMRALREKYP
jgi:putative addiction module component (TIGR02574 family)